MLSYKIIPDCITKELSCKKQKKPCTYSKISITYIIVNYEVVIDDSVLLLFTLSLILHTAHSGIHHGFSYLLLTPEIQDQRALV